MDNREEERKLLRNIKENLKPLEDLLEEVNSHWGYEDGFYRFYHQSYKVFNLQELTDEIVIALRGLAPDLTLNKWFLSIVEEGTGKEFELEMNDNWLQATRPILEAFFHARYFLEMACKYGKELKEPPEVLPSGWAAVLCLYDLR